MKKFLTVAILLFSTAVYAQETIVKDINSKDIRVVKTETDDVHLVETNHFLGNWYLSFGIGGQMYFGDHNNQMKFGDRLTPAIEVALGKWFTPGLGFRFMYSGYSFKGLTQSGVHSKGKMYDAEQNLKEQRFDFAHFQGQILLNLNNLFCGFKETRVWTVSPYAALGIALKTSEPTQKDVTAGIGALNSFRIGKALDFNVDVRASAVADRFDGELGGRRHEGFLSATLGLTYKFKPRGWKKSTTTYVYDEGEINRLKNLNSELEDNIKALNDSLANRPAAAADSVLLEATATYPMFVRFELAKTNIIPEAKVNLSLFADMVREVTPNTPYIITGYADKGTGSAEINNRLSEARAREVYRCLVHEFGLPASQFEVDFKGGVDDMFFADPRLSRAVIIIAK